MRTRQAKSVSTSRGEKWAEHAADGNYEAAWNIPWWAASVAPNYSKIYIALSGIARIEGNGYQSKMLLRRALAYDPNDTEALSKLGVLRCQQGHMHEADELAGRPPIDP